MSDTVTPMLSYNEIGHAVYHLKLVTPNHEALRNKGAIEIIRECLGLYETMNDERFAEIRRYANVLNKIARSTPLLADTEYLGLKGAHCHWVPEHVCPTPLCEKKTRLLKEHREAEADIEKRFEDAMAELRRKLDGYIAIEGLKEAPKALTAVPL